MRDPSLAPVHREEAGMCRAGPQRPGPCSPTLPRARREENRSKSITGLKKGKAERAQRELERRGRSALPPAGRTGKTPQSRNDGTPEPEAPDSGKWAKSKADGARCDPALTGLCRDTWPGTELTHKLQAASQSEEEGDPLVPGAVNEVQMTAGGPDP